MTEIRFAQHAPIAAFEVAGAELAVGGVPVLRLAERVGRTPFYAYDRAAITARVRSLREALPSALQLHYAIKANPMPAVVQHLAALTDGLDVASAGEMSARELLLVGLHIFGGSQNLRAEAIVDAQQKTYELGRRLLAHWGRPVQWLNLGGGFGVPYFPGEQPLDLAPIGAALGTLCERAARDLEAPLVLELGRYFVAEAGVYVCRVLERKNSCGQVFLVTDGGLHHHLSASGNFGQVLRKNYPVAVANRIGAPLDQAQSVVGPLCTPLDLLADRMMLAHAEPGDLVAVFQSGAYGLTASPTAFLGHPAPAEVLV